MAVVTISVVITAVAQKGLSNLVYVNIIPIGGDSTGAYHGKEK